MVPITRALACAFASWSNFCVVLLDDRPSHVEGVVFIRVLFSVWWHHSLREFEYFDGTTAFCLNLQQCLVVLFFSCAAQFSSPHFSRWVPPRRSTDSSAHFSVTTSTITEQWIPIRRTDICSVLWPGRLSACSWVCYHGYVFGWCFLFPKKGLMESESVHKVWNA